MGLILPTTCLAGPPTGKKSGICGRSEYHDVVVITIADAKGDSCAFSADTSMTECMVVATKGKKTDSTRVEARFVSLNHRPPSVLEALEIVNNTCAATW